MIPKKIHYCWFGGNELTTLAKKCIASWKKFCSDYEIIRWDESNYDVTKCDYMNSAYKEKKWAFVSDYARLDIIYQYGGFYLDTDVEIIKPLDNLLEYDGIMGFEGSFKVAGGLIIAGIPQLPVFMEMADLYKRVSFYNEDGSLNLTPSPVYNTKVLTQYGLKEDNTKQIVQGVTIFPTDYFCPKDILTCSLNITENTYTIHHYDGSWLSFPERFGIKIVWRVTKIFGKKIGMHVLNFCRMKIKKIFRKDY